MSGHNNASGMLWPSRKCHLPQGGLTALKLIFVVFSTIPPFTGNFLNNVILIVQPVKMDYVAWLSPGNLLSILPHLTLPILVLLAFSSPPFHGRGVFFVTLIIANDYACAASPWPPNAGTTRAMRYGMAGSWLLILPAVERLLLHVPERDFWLLDQQGQVNNGRPKEWTWDKVRWAIKLVTSSQGVGWNFGHRKANDARSAIKAQQLSRQQFVMARMPRAILAYVGLDVAINVARSTTIPHSWSWEMDSLKQIVYVELLMGLSLYTTMTLQHEAVAMITVGLFGGQPEDWPPLFGNISDCYTVGNVWGKYWHGYIRQPVLGISRVIVKNLCLPPRSPHAYFIHLITAFSISGFFHFFALSVVCEGYIEPIKLALNMGLFFMVQPCGTMIEYAVVHLCQGTRWSEYLITGTKSERTVLDGVPQMLVRVLGYVWVFCWFIWTGWWFVEAYAAIGVLEWTLPVSFWSV